LTGVRIVCRFVVVVVVIVVDGEVTSVALLLSLVSFHLLGHLFLQQLLHVDLPLFELLRQFNLLLDGLKKLRVDLENKVFVCFYK
jgi:hypothetical protein